jgi:hypothetical protein
VNIVRRMQQLVVIVGLLLISCTGDGSKRPLIPKIVGDWWIIAGDPDLGEYNSEKQQPVDFAVWRASNGTWKLWSCIRHTKCGGMTRLFNRWEGENILDSDWTPMGIAMEADTTLGETLGGMQAPYVLKKDGKYVMFYGDWNRICLAESEDGKQFERTSNENGEPSLFEGPYMNTRDPMVLEHDGTYYCYYTGHLRRESQERHKCAVFCRTSSDLLNWSNPVKVCAGGSPSGTTWFGGDCECPFVVEIDGLFYLFRNQRYGMNNLNTQYCSSDPLDFGVDNDKKIVRELPVAAPEIIKHKNKYYIAALLTNLKGIRMARLEWVKSDRVIKKR